MAMLLNAKPLTFAFSIFVIIRLSKFSVLSELFHYLHKVLRRATESSKQLQMWMEFGISDVLKKRGGREWRKTTTKQTKQETQSQ